MSKNNNQHSFFQLLASYLLVFIIFAVFSFVFTDPNLTLINNQFFINWQQFLWQNILPNIYLRSGIYIILITLLFLNYHCLIKFLPKKITIFNKKILFLLFFLVFFLLISYNALSHDLFNYIFNARMLIKYQANPHQLVALTFAYDPWSRFMHNIHTTAPYGQVWTFISTIPYYLGFDKFLITWLNFKAFAFLGMFITLLILKKFLVNEKNRNYKLAILFLNPLILIETIVNAHNDWWMMWPVLASFLLAKKFKKSHKKNYFLLILIVCLMFFSIFTKFASLVAIPFLIYYLIEEKLDQFKVFKKQLLTKAKKFINEYFWDLVSIAFFLPLFTARSQRFLTWYLIWPMAFLPLVKSKWWQNNLLIFSASGLVSYLIWIIYIPWLNFDRILPNVLFYKQLVLWLPVLFFNIFFLGKYIIQRAKNKA